MAPGDRGRLCPAGSLRVVCALPAATAGHARHHGSRDDECAARPAGGAQLPLPAPQDARKQRRPQRVAGQQNLQRRDTA